MNKIEITSKTETIPVDPEDKCTYTYHSVHVIGNDGKPANDKFFVGRLPQVGEAVEMVYVGDTDDGAMRFQLRVKDAAAATKS